MASGWSLSRMCRAAIAAAHFNAFVSGPVHASDRIRELSRQAERIVSYLADDSLAGRGNGTRELEAAADFISREFAAAGLQPFEGAQAYRQEFSFGSWKLANIIGVLPGTSRPEEIVIVSAHYDHLGKRGLDGDTIYNGANDNASGVAAVIALAKMLAREGSNARTLMFVAFAGEEAGTLGSFHLSSRLDRSKVVAMINIEMIGMRSEWGAKTAFITGMQFTDLGEIIAASAPQSFSFRTDQYPKGMLFLRSDNMPFAILGIPALTVSAYNPHADKTYHTPDDEVASLDFDNLAAVIDALAPGIRATVNGKHTPKRIDVYGAATKQ